MKDIKAGDYIVNKAMSLEGIVIEKYSENVKMFCTKDEVYPLNIGKIITFALHKSWKVEIDREYK
tara:strand:+ start:427 stop:621 length:195 start_codon:yes stop_codon:yes gene_type:complete